ncbi:MAG: DUF111 family protein [Pedosphaera sp.]|nr:DUF111 family protein [Pedosphaera sp.]
MKKNRPSVLLTVLCSESDMDRFTEKLLRETTAFGVRRSTLERHKLVSVRRTPWFPIRLPWV